MNFLNIYKYEFNPLLVEIYISTVGGLNTYYAHVLTLKFYFHHARILFRHSYNSMFKSKNLFHHASIRWLKTYYVILLECSISPCF